MLTKCRLLRDGLENRVTDNPNNNNKEAEVGNKIFCKVSQLNEQ